MKRLQILSLAVVLSSAVSLAQEHGTEVQAPNQDPSRNSIEAATETAPSTEGLTSWMLIPQISIVSPMAFELKTGPYTFPYSDNFAGLPVLSFAAARSMFGAGNLRVYGEARVAFGFKSGVYSYRDSNGGTHQDQLNLHWLPLSGGLRAIYHIPTVNFLKPTLAAGGGVQWFHQSGDRVELSDSHWIPFFYVSPGMVFLESTSSKDWFGGFNFSTTFMSSFASSQVVRGLGFDLSLNILL